MYLFHEFLGNTLLIKNLKSAIQNHSISHAYIISGGEGLGKKTLANTFAKALQCQSFHLDACGVCPSCHAFDSGNHPDIFYVKGTKASLGVDDIRKQVLEEAVIKPYKYPYKIFVIDKADTMTAQAQNALLKTLEEPPNYGVFLLLASNMNQFLPTVLSRCVVLKMHELSSSYIKEYLEQKKGILPDQAAVFAEYARGSLGSAITISGSEEFVAMREQILSWASSIWKRDLVDTLAIAKEMEQYKERPEFLDIFYLWYRDTFVLKKTGSMQFVIQKDKQDALINAAEQDTIYNLNKKLDAVWTAKKQINQNANFQLTLEVLLMNIKERSS